MWLTSRLIFILSEEKNTAISLSGSPIWTSECVSDSPFPSLHDGSLLFQPAAWRQTRIRSEGRALCLPTTTQTSLTLSPPSFLNFSWFTHPDHFLSVPSSLQSFLNIQREICIICIWLTLWVLEKLVIIVNKCSTTGFKDRQSSPAGCYMMRPLTIKPNWGGWCF